MTLLHLAVSLMLVAARQGASPLPADTVTAESLVIRYLRAIGGLERLRAVVSRRMSGTYREGDFNATTVILARRPNLRRVTVNAPDGYAYVEIFDGTTEWEYSDRFSRAVQRDTGAAERAGRRGAEFDESFIDAAQKGHRLVSRERSTLAGREVYAVHVVLADGWDKDYYFDATTGLLFAMRKAMPLHATGPDVESLSFYSDYRDVAGILVPFTSEERNSRTGQLMNTLHWQKIEFNVEIRDEAFHPPR